LRYKTIPDMFYKQAEKYKNRVVRKYKKGDRWIDITWEGVQEQVENFAMGLMKLGIKRNDKVAILSENRNEWYISDMAIQSIGAIVVPVYPSNTADQIYYILKDADVVAIILSTRHQYRKVEQKKSELKDLRFIIMMDDDIPGDEFVTRFGHIISYGKLSGLKAELQKRLANISSNDVATIMYTSGTTGNSKGVMLTHYNILSDTEAIYETLKDFMGEEVLLSFLPLSHPFARIADCYVAMYHGRGVQVLSESLEKLAENLMEIKPTMFVSVPRVFEKLYDRIITEVETEPPLKRRLFHWAVSVGKQAAPYQLKGKPLPFGLSIKHGIASELVFKKIKQALGGRLNFAFSGGAPLSKELQEFFFLFGVKIIEGYGLTETSAVLTINLPDKIKFGSVGKPIGGCELKIDNDGEILAKGPMVMKGYYKNPDATKEIIDADSWLHTGDIGFVDDEGYLHITDRKKDIIVTAGGKNIAPQPIENKLKMNKYIEEVVIIGDRKPYCVALIVPSFEALEEIAKRENIIYSSREELLENPRIKALIDVAIAEVNRGLARYETIKKFALIPKLFTLETGELTPTLKVKRWAIAQKYKDIIEQLYEMQATRLVAEI